MEIDNYNIYLERMHGPMKDKLFFLKEFEDAGIIDEIDTVVDFGCADAELFKYLPDKWKKIGVDNSLQMRRLAQSNYPKGIYTSSMYSANMIKEGKSVLIMNSVLHEVYNYMKSDEIADLWIDISDGFYDYIVIRDMCYTWVDDKKKLDKELLDKIVESEHLDYFLDYQEKFLKREAKYQKDLVQFLLKYKYKENWDRECVENYFSYDQFEILDRVSIANSEIMYCKMFTLPYIKDMIKKDFDYDLKETTHMKLILKRPNFELTEGN